MTNIQTGQIKLVKILDIIPHPDNNNRHSIEQIKQLEYMIDTKGFRDPLIISNLSGFLICGHGRLQAASNLGYEKVPVMHQSFKSEADEYEFMTGHNEIHRWSELDYHAVKIKMETLHLDIKATAIKSLEPIKQEILGEDKPPKTKKDIECPECGALI